MNNFISIKEAWRVMFQERTCPPYSVLKDSAEDESVAEHRKTCPVCAMKSGQVVDHAAWAELGAAMARDWPSPKKLPVQVGQIWSLSASKGGWDEEFRHVNPPLVLVVDIFEDVAGVRVAQLFDERVLMAAGDVDLGPRFGVAEAWNTYALDQADLEWCFGKIEQSVLEAVCNASGAEMHPLKENSIVWHFRQLELEIGSTMAMEAMGRLMERHERNAVREEFADVEAVAKKVLEFNPRIRLQKSENGLEMLATAVLPEELMLKAAASEGRHFPVTVVSVGGATSPCRGVLAQMLEADHQDAVIRITGRIEDENREGLLFAWWRRPDVGLEEGIAQFDASNGIFSASFSGKSELDFKIGEPLLVLVQIEDDQD